MSQSYKSHKLDGRLTIVVESNFDERCQGILFIYFLYM